MMTFDKIFPLFLETGNPITRNSFKDRWFLKFNKGQIQFCEWVSSHNWEWSSPTIKTDHLLGDDWQFLN